MTYLTIFFFKEILQDRINEDNDKVENILYIILCS